MKIGESKQVAFPCEVCGADVVVVATGDFADHWADGLVEFRCLDCAAGSSPENENEAGE